MLAELFVDREHIEIVRVLGHPWGFGFEEVIAMAE